VQNALARIEGLSGLINLNTLNLSQNAIERIDTGALSGLPALATLVLSKNRFQTAADVEAILECPSITNVDLSSNDIEDADVVSIVAGLPNLACLSLTGNPFLRTTRQYRKSTLVAMPKLTHLDDRPVFEEERIAVTAWEKGGATAERDARKVRLTGLPVPCSCLELLALRVANVVSKVPRCVSRSAGLQGGDAEA
jgi:dynein assembly factor 1